MDLNKKLIALTGCFWLISCLHPSQPGEGSRPVLTQPIFRSDVAVWVDYTNTLDGMAPKDLKSEYERLRRIADRAWDDELRLSLTSCVQSQKLKNYQKASEIIAQAAGKIQGNTDLRSWLRFYSQQVSVLAQMDRELTEEKRLRSELEKKLKALSDIERDISERSKSPGMTHP